VICNNPGLEEVPYLPPSLKVLQADRRHIIRFDFARLLRLRELVIYNGKTEQNELKNLRQLKVFDGNC
jgi:hypothetical protein